MREIKFRQWSSGSFHYWGHGVDCFTGPLSNRLDIPSEQFTGLHDKNGKEIYEGDVVRQSVLLSGDMVDNPVKWIDCGFVANGLLGKREAENCEVIGNIHEDGNAQ